MAKKINIDPEIEAIRICIKAFEKIDPAARRRVYEYVTSYYKRTAQ